MNYEFNTDVILLVNEVKRNCNNLMFNMSTCRVCLLTKNNMIPLNEKFINNYNLLTNLSVTLFDDLPQSCCQECEDIVNYFIYFREKCIASEHTLNDSKIKCKIDSSDECFNDETSCAEDFDENIVIKEEKLEVNTEEFQLPLKTKIECNTKTKIAKASKKYNKDIYFYCGICVEKFDDKEAVQNHLVSHVNSKNCGVCHEMFVTWAQLYSHRIIHLPISQQMCHMCSKQYRTCYGLEYHYLHEHNENLEKKLRCKLCFSSFDTPKQFKKHRFYVHSEKKFSCKLCSKRFAIESAFMMHVEKHKIIMKYTCDICGYSTKYKPNLRDHILRHAPDKVICQKCEKVFESKEYLKKHSCKTKTAVCQKCGVQMESSRKLNSHMRVHKEKDQHKCDRCPKTYKTKQSLLVHINRHDGVRPHKCEYCPATFFSATVLIKHRRTHTGERPYVCTICSKSFMANHNLKMHMRTHGQYLIVKRDKENELA